MLGIISELKNMMSNLAEAKFLIEGQCPGVVLPDAKPDLISIASGRGSEHLGHERLSDTFAMPLLIYIYALDSAGLAASTHGGAVPHRSWA